MSIYPMISKFSTLVATCLLTTNSLFATPGDPVKPASFYTSIYVTPTNKIRLSVNKVTPEPVVISLRQAGAGADQSLIFLRQMSKKQTKLALQLDMSELSDGVYELEVLSANNRMVKQVTLATPVKVNESTRTIVMP